jgi:hypothetical protein
MLQDSPTAVVAHIIQLAVAPVFLLAGISGILVVMTNRLGRIVDRARQLEDQVANASTPADVHDDELRLLSRRARLIGIAIGLCTLTALLVCTVIAILFLASFVTFDAAAAVALLFITAMVAFITGLLFLLREISLALAGLRFGRRAAATASPPGEDVRR